MWFVVWAAASWAGDSLVVAARDLYPGVVIEAGDVILLPVTSAGRPAFPADALTALDQVVGRTPRERVLANEAVRPSRLYDPSALEAWQAVSAVRDVVVALPVESWVAAEAHRASGLRAVPATGATEAACP